MFTYIALPLLCFFEIEKTNQGRPLPLIIEKIRMKKVFLKKLQSSYRILY